ncbi:MAG: hypothetical protein M1830_010576 [Pleopsidium flavum]|nr:MAG: hypothetical protein M1830_010576 [Pleopsidium flavum]
MPGSTKEHQENQGRWRFGSVPVGEAEANGSTAIGGTISPCLGINPVANKSMESLQILQWCQGIDLPRPATNEGLECYKEASRFLPNKDAQIEIPKWSALVVRMRELQQQYKPLQDRENLSQEENNRRGEIKAEWARLKPKHEDLVQRLSRKRDLFDMCKHYRRTSQDARARAEAAEDARLEMQTGMFSTTSAAAHLPHVQHGHSQQMLDAPENSPWTATAQVNGDTSSARENISPSTQP